VTVLRITVEKNYRLAFSGEQVMKLDAVDRLEAVLNRDTSRWRKRIRRVSSMSIREDGRYLYRIGGGGVSGDFFI